MPGWKHLSGISISGGKVFVATYDSGDSGVYAWSPQP